MPSTFSTNLRLTLQADGENASTWGDIANAVFNLIESAITGTAAVVLSSGTTTLTTNNGAADQARQAILLLTGNLSGNVLLVIPNVSKPYIIFNNTTGAFSVTVQTAAPVLSVALTQGVSQIVFCDGANNVYIPVANATTLAGIAASNYARKDAGQSNQFLARNAETFVNVAYAGSITLDASTGNSFSTTVSGATTLATPTNAVDGQTIAWFLTQDATGGRTVGFGAGWLFPNGVPSQVDVTPNATTALIAKYFGALAKWIVYAVYTGYNGTAVTGNITIAQNTMDFNLFQQMGSPAGAVNVTVTVNQGVRVQASEASSYAMDLSGFTSGSVISLINKGFIWARGGDGANGAEAGQNGSTLTDVTQGKKGRDGGTAIFGPSSGNTLNITNAGGQIFGGGGGGGGGGASPPGGAQATNGGGGGGGAGRGRGGFGGSAQIGGGATAPAANGTDGTTPTAGANGTGGAGAGTGGGGQSGGNGGDWGAAGTAGTNGSSIGGGAGGAAGPAINRNGGTASFLSGGTSPNVKGAII